MNEKYDLWLDNEKSIKQLIVLETSEKWMRQNVRGDDEKTDYLSDGQTMFDRDKTIPLGRHMAHPPILWSL